MPPELPPVDISKMSDDEFADYVDGD